MKAKVSGLLGSGSGSFANDEVEDDFLWKMMYPGLGRLPFGAPPGSMEPGAIPVLCWIRIQL